MRRLTALCLLCVVFSFGVARDTSAARPHGVGTSPEITSVEWLDEPAAGEEAWLEVWSVDEHGVIVEVMIDWGDGTFDFAHSYCLQGPERGLPHRMLLPHTYQEPGLYEITIVAISKPSCYAPNGSSRESKEVTIDVAVMP